MPNRYTHTLMFLTREMNEEASIQERLDNLHNLWGKEGFTESKKGNCHGCGAHLTERFYLDHEETGRDATLDQAARNYSNILHRNFMNRC